MAIRHRNFYNVLRLWMRHCPIPTYHEDAYRPFEIFHVLEPIQSSTRYSIRQIINVKNLHIIVETADVRCSHDKRSRLQRELGQLRVPIVTGVGVRWKMVRMSLPCESRCWACCAASWAANKASSVVPAAPIAEPTTPPALLRSPVICHVPSAAKIIYHPPISLNVLTH